MARDVAMSLLSEPYKSLEDATAAALQLAHGGYLVILDHPTRVGDVHTMARVQDRVSGVTVGFLEYYA